MAAVNLFRHDWVKVAIAGSAVFLVLSTLYRNFVLDDAFIAFRYASNLSEGHGLVWNVGENPVEGFTSLLWVLVNSVGIDAGLDPVWVSKTLSVLAALTTIWIISFAGKRLHWTWTSVWTVALAANPLYAFLSMQGMETSTVALVCIIVALTASMVDSMPPLRFAVFFSGLSLLAVVSRPDAVPFLAGPWMVVAVTAWRNRDRDSLKAISWAMLLFVITLLVYALWKIQYFGQLLPNTYFVKVPRSGGVLSPAGIRYLASFFAVFLLPFVLLTAFSSIRKPVAAIDRATSGILIGCVLHFFYIATITPIQGFFWRFIFPVVPALFLAAIRVQERCVPVNPILSRRMAGATMLAFALAWNLRFVPETLREMRYRSPHDRIAVGRRLEGIDGVMFTSEAGALPFYSRWKAVDLIGLTSESIARNGFSIDALRAVDPDLVIVHSMMFQRRPDRRAILEEYFEERHFKAIAAARRSEGVFICYFLTVESPIWEEVVERIRGTEGIFFGNLEKVLSGVAVDLHKFK